jgi:hypothetical protein
MEDPVYKVHPVTRWYIGDPTWDTAATMILNLDSYLRNVKGVTLANEDAAGVTARKAARNNTSERFDIIRSTREFSEDAAEAEVNARIDHSEALSPAVVMGALEQAEFNDRSEVTEETYASFRRQILSSISFLKFNQALSLLHPHGRKEENPANLNEATEALDNGTEGSRRVLLFQIVLSTCEKLLKGMVSQMQDGEEEASAIRNLSVHFGGFRAPFYYNLRTELAKSLAIPESVIPGYHADVMVYIKKILADIYIKTCYPLIHHDFLFAIQVAAAQRGDFVNLRLSGASAMLLAHSYVRHVHDNHYNANYGSLSLPQRTKYSSILKRCFTILQNHLKSMNEAFGSTVEAEVLRDLHKMSKENVQTSEKNQGLRSSTEEHEVSYRRVFQTHRIAEAKARAARRWFRVVVWATVIWMLAICATAVFKRTSRLAFIFALGTVCAWLAGTLAVWVYKKIYT